MRYNNIKLKCKLCCQATQLFFFPERTIHINYICKVFWKGVWGRTFCSQKVSPNLKRSDLSQLSSAATSHSSQAQRPLTALKRSDLSQLSSAATSHSSRAQRLISGADAEVRKHHSADVIEAVEGAEVLRPDGFAADKEGDILS